ncbi:MAG: hypothetical protein ACK55Z_16935 [bacterium]
MLLRATVIWRPDSVADSVHLYSSFIKAAGLAIGIVGDAGVRANA